MANLWYIAQDKKKAGPFSTAELRQMALAGQLQPFDMVLLVGSDKWVQARDVDGLFSGTASSTAPTASANTRQEHGQFSLYQETKETVAACWKQTQRFLYYGKALWRQGEANRAAARAELKFGERLYEAGLGDAQIRSQVADLDKRIKLATEKAKSTGSHLSERTLLLRNLAKGMIGRNVSADIGVEHDQAKVAQKVLEQQQEFVQHARNELLPPGGQEQRRVGIGFTVMLAGCVLMLALVIGLMFWPGAGRNSAPVLVAQKAKTQPPQPNTQLPQPKTQPVANGPVVFPGGVTREATLNYWIGANGLITKAGALQADPKQQTWALRNAAQIIRQNPTLGVDLDLVNWALRMATVLDQKADLDSVAEDPLFLLEVITRGMQGDPFGVAVELNQAQRAWLANARAVSQQGYQLRAVLTARYGIQFP